MKKSIAKSVLKLFKENGINAVSMKLYSDDEDIDIVIINKSKYKKAKNILGSKGWFIKNNKSKLRERDKDFFKHRKSAFFIHLHKNFSWNTVVYLNSKTVWKRRRRIEGVDCPSVEDELLIIAAHSFFENQYVVPEELIYAKKLFKNKVDLKYMKRCAKNLNWESGLDIILLKLKNNDPFLSIGELLSVKATKIIEDFGKVSFGQTITEATNYFLIDWVWNYRILLKKQLKDAPIVISLSGVDGSGKSTQTNLLQYFFIKKHQLTKVVHVGGDFSKDDTSEKYYKIPILGYVAFIKDILSIFFLYVTNYKADVLIYDRYIYDSLIKVSYKQNLKKINKNLILISKLLPKTNLSLLLRVPPKLSYKRDQEHSLSYHNVKYQLYGSLIPLFSNIKEVDGTKDKTYVLKHLTYQKVI